MAGNSWAGSLQEQLESGGKQFDKAGKPLVGRHRDGSIPPPNQRAYGRAQMQIGTAKDVAAKHGIPWDEKRFLNDGEYNANLGGLHMGDLRAKYGDDRLAYGAYHSGAGTVDAAIQKYGRAGFTKGLGPEGRNYVAKLSGGASSMASGGLGAALGQVVQARDVTATQATDAEKLVMQGPYQGVQSASDPAIQGQVKGAVGELQRRASLADTLLQESTAQSAEIRQSQLQELDQTVAKKRALFQHGEETTQALINASAPIFQQRKQIQDRRSEIARMNPFVAMVKGVIDPDYNSDSLESRDNMLRSDQQLLDEEYTHQNNLHSKLIDYASLESADQQALYRAQLGNLDENMRLAVQSYEMGGAQLSVLMQGFQTDSALIAAKTTQTQNFLTNASEGVINEAMNQAAANPNRMVEVEGMQIPLAALQGEQERRVEGAYHLANIKNAAALQNEAAVVAGQDRWLRTASLPELQEMAKNGYVKDGVQFDQVKVGQRMAQLREVSAGQAEDAVLASTQGQWSSGVASYVDYGKAMNMRLTQMFGTSPPGYSEQATRDNVRIIQISNQIKALRESGQEDAAQRLTVQGMQEIGEMNKAREASVAGTIKKWAGGNSDLERLGTAWALGVPVEPGVAINAMIHMARVGAPGGLRFQGTSAKIFNEVIAQVQKFDRENVGDDLLKGTAGAKGQKLIQDIQARIGSLFNSDLLNSQLQKAPQTARHVLVNGRVHPFSMVSQELMTEAINTGDARGYATMAQMLSIPQNEIKGFFLKPADSPEWTNLMKTRKPGENTKDYWVKALQSAQTSQMFAVLDSHRTDAMPFAPSTMLKDLLQKPQFREAARNDGFIQERSTLGGFVAGAAAGGSFENSIGNYTQRVVAAHNSYRAQAINSINDKGRALRTAPLARFNYIVDTIPGISDEEGKYLTNHVKQLTGITPGEGLALQTIGDQGMTADAYAGRAWQAIDSAMKTKMEDPRAEAIRRRIAPQWQLFSDSADKMSKSPWYVGDR